MYFYWGIGLLVGILTKLASLMFWKKEKHLTYKALGVIISIITICIICGVAGFRDPYFVGTDSDLYGIEDFHNGISLSFQHFSELSAYKRYPILCKLIMWASANVAQNFFVYLFMLEAFTVIPVYIVILRSSKNFSWLGMFIYCSWMLPLSFNAIRQCIAQAYTLIAIYYCMKDRYIRALLFVVIGWQIHTSASVAFFYIPICWYLNTYNKFIVKKLWFKCFVVVAIAFVSQIFVQPWMYFLFKDDDTFGFYTASTIQESSLTVILLLVFLSFIAIAFSIIKKNDKQKEYFNVIYMMVLFAVGISSQALGMQFQWLFRIAYYYFIVWLLLFPKICDVVEGKYEKIAFVILALIFIMGFTYGTFEYKGFNEVVPYIFRNNLVLGV